MFLGESSFIFVFLTIFDPFWILVESSSDIHRALSARNINEEFTILPTGEATRNVISIRLIDHIRIMWRSSHAFSSYTDLTDQSR